MSISTELRIQKLQEVVEESQPCGSKRIIYKSKKNDDMYAYEIPIEYLILNKYNGRIGTLVKTYEKQYGEIDATTEEGEEQIRNFLWKSSKHRNEETQKSIADIGQTEIGIVTKDGVVIDGNRRCMILKKLDKRYFRAVILPDTLESNPKEIRKLETIYQMGVDEKVDYNAIEKYLKCKDLHKEDGASYKEIAKWMGEKESDIETYLDILKLMEEYLKNYGYQGMYSRLNEEKVEGPFVDLTRYLERQRTGERVQGRDWEPNEEDIDDLKKFTFDYIRGGFRTHNGIRYIGNPSKGGGFFNHEKIWKQFVQRYKENIEPINDNEKHLDEWIKERPNEGVEKVIRAREEEWKKQAENPLKENHGRTQRALEDKAAADSPMELLQRAENTLNSINTDIPAFDENVLDQVKKISKIAWNFQQIIKKK